MATFLQLLMLSLELRTVGDNHLGTQEYDCGHIFSSIIIIRVDSEHSSKVILVRGVGVSCGRTASELSPKLVLLHSPVSNLPERRSKPLAPSLTGLLLSVTETPSALSSEFQAGPGTAAWEKYPECHILVSGSRHASRSLSLWL